MFWTKITHFGNIFFGRNLSIAYNDKNYSNCFTHILMIKNDSIYMDGSLKFENFRYELIFTVMVQWINVRSFGALTCTSAWNKRYLRSKLFKNDHLLTYDNSKVHQLRYVIIVYSLGISSHNLCEIWSQLFFLSNFTGIHETTLSILILIISFLNPSNLLYTRF